MAQTPEDTTPIAVMKHSSSGTTMIPTTPGPIPEHATRVRRDTNLSSCAASGKVDLVRDVSGVDLLVSEHGMDWNQVRGYRELMNSTDVSAGSWVSEEGVNPSEVIKDTVNLVRALDQHAINIQTRSLPEHLRMPILKSHLQRVVYNVVKHALEGLSDVGGCVVVAAAVREQDHRNPRVRLNCRQALHLTIEATRPSPSSELQHGSHSPHDRKKLKDDALRVDHARLVLDQYGGLLRIERLMDHSTRTHIIWPY
jgi:hypothetical protein